MMPLALAAGSVALSSARALRRGPLWTYMVLIVVSALASVEDAGEFDHPYAMPYERHAVVLRG